jgi:hypothetical protein
MCEKCVEPNEAELEQFKHGVDRRVRIIMLAALACVRSLRRQKSVSAHNEAYTRFIPFYQRELIEAVDEWERYTTSGETETGKPPQSQDSGICGFCYLPISMHEWTELNGCPAMLCDKAPEDEVHFMGQSEVEKLLPLQSKNVRMRKDGLLEVEPSARGISPSFIPMAHENKSIKERHEMWDMVGGPNRGPMPDDFMADENKPTVIANDRGRFEVNGYELPVLFDTTRREGTRIPLSPLSNTPIANVSIPGYQKMWLCSNHPPGSAVEVKKGEKCCVCGRTE